MTQTSSGLLADRAALVTGGARGLGFAMVRAFADQGAIGAVFDRPEVLATADLPAGWIGIAADVRDEAAMVTAFDQAVGTLGRLDAVVANAGIVPPWRDTDSIDLAEWDAVFAVNVRGVIATIKHAVPRMRQPGGCIVAMASMNASRAHPRQCLYTASKHAVLGIVRATALDLGGLGIRVNAVAPGPVMTGALRGRMEARAAQGGAAVDAAVAAASDTALRRMATEREVAAVALFLASDLSDGMTGAMLPVDGGLA